MSKKELPIVYSNLQYKMGHYFLDTQYDISFKLKLIQMTNKQPKFNDLVVTLLKLLEYLKLNISKK